jgi:hypothetical protein
MFPGDLGTLLDALLQWWSLLRLRREKISPQHVDKALTATRPNCDNPAMSFQDIEAGRAPPNPQLFSSLSGAPAAQSSEDATFQNLQSSLSLQVFKMNANVQGMLRLVDQLGTQKDSAGLRKSL